MTVVHQDHNPAYVLNDRANIIQEELTALTRRFEALEKQSLQDSFMKSRAKGSPAPVHNIPTLPYQFQQHWEELNKLRERIEHNGGIDRVFEVVRMIDNSPSPEPDFLSMLQNQVGEGGQQQQDNDDDEDRKSESEYNSKNASSRMSSKTPSPRGASSRATPVIMNGETIQETSEVEGEAETEGDKESKIETAVAPQQHHHHQHHHHHHHEKTDQTE